MVIASLENRLQLIDSSVSKSMSNLRNTVHEVKSDETKTLMPTDNIQRFTGQIYLQFIQRTKEIFTILLVLKAQLMKNFGSTLLLLLITISSYGQLADSLWFFFEDAVGNRDSVLYGGVYEGDPIPDKHKNSEFNIFNEDFAVGIAKFFPHEDIQPDNLQFCKKMVVTWIDNFKGSAYNQLYIRLKHPPLKISFDPKFFDTNDSRGCYMTSDYRVELIFPNAFGTIDRFECLYGRDSLLWELGTEFMHLDALPMYKQANLSNGTIDTIWGLRHSDLYWPKHALGTPCPYPVSTNDVFSDYSINLIQDGHTLSIHNRSSQDIMGLAIFSVSGHQLSQISRGIHSGQSLDVAINNYPPGLYILQAQLDSGSKISYKLILTQ